MPKRLPVHGLDPADGSPGQGPIIDPTGSRFILGDVGGGAGWSTIDLCTDFGVHLGDGNDYNSEVQNALDEVEASGAGARFWFSEGPGAAGGQIVLDGALQDTGGANAQLILPTIDAVDGKQISVEFWGNQPPSQGFSVVGATDAPTDHVYFESTIAGTAGGAVIGAKGPSGTFEDFTYLQFGMRNMGLRLPSNPVMTALDLSRVTDIELENVVVDASGYYVQGFTQPTTSSAYGIKGPKNNNGAFSGYRGTAVAGFYTGYQFAEHTMGGQVNAWGCLRAAEFAAAANHGSWIARLMAVHCPTGLVFTGSHAIRIAQYAVEHATSGWWAPTPGTNYDVDDPSDYGVGGLEYRVVKAGVGPDHTFAQSGTVFKAREIGTADASALTVKDEGSTLTSAATSMDFVGAGVTATNTGGAVTVTIPGATASTGELVMQDGVTAPPVPVENEAQDDWLYAD